MRTVDIEDRSVTSAIGRLAKWIGRPSASRRILCGFGLAGVILITTGTARASGRIESKWASHGTSSDTDPASPFWRGVPAVFAQRNKDGSMARKYRMEVRSRWTAHSLYFLFVCPYVQLNLKPDPKTDVETNHLWQWDVAEAFIGSDFHDIRKYKEFEVSPQGEWVDLSIDLDRLTDSHGWKWNSGMKVAARIDPKTHRWYAFMKIPYKSVDSRPASVGNLLRVNFFLSEGPAPEHQEITWQPTHRETFHVPEAFGLLELVKH